MKIWQYITLILMASFVCLVSMAGAVLIYAALVPVPTPEIVQLPAQIIKVEIPVPGPVVVITPEPIIQEVSISQPVIDTLPTPTPLVEVEEPEVKCSDAASLSVNTPYFKTFKPQVTAEVVVYNMGNCIWEANSRYIAPFSTYVPVEVLPGGFAVVQVVVNTTPGLSVITPVVMGEFNESLMPQAMAAPAEFEMDYANPVSSVPAGSIVINFPTKDWVGLQYPKWKQIPGLPGWWTIEGGNGTGYNYGGCSGGG